ncbi:MAG: hypothetical protein OEN01_08415 [Candidatus Krumholzibacteria bacterium]|nr:hypothetical protein [Candidatus Krumholzibacteria bacterium]
MTALCRSLIGTLGMVVMLGFTTMEVAAYPRYDQGCMACHGDFNSGSYVSMSDGQAWGTNLMDGHLNAFVPGGCDVCHKSGPRGDVALNLSSGEGGLDPIGCLGCHGRDEGSGVSGAGLRQHHYNNFVTVCGNAGCHPGDANPAVFTTVGEHVMPPYYANPGTFSATIPDSPCNEAPGYTEDVLGVAGTGLDNDGDNVYDDTDACVATGIEDKLSYNLELHQNFPNPFNPGTTIRFSLQHVSKVRLDIFTSDGGLVRTLLAQELPPGVYDIPWNGRDAAGSPISSGVYFYRLQSAEEQLTNRMILLK